MNIVKPSIELLWHTEDPEIQIERAGRTCYKSEDRINQSSAEKICRALRKSGHHAMIEHAVASFRIVTDRGITHEIVRHRLASYAQESTRYCNYSKDKFSNECSFIKPPGLSKTQVGYWKSACRIAEGYYFEMIEEGCSPQIARSVLPNCLKTEIVMMANFREWRHFIKLRAEKVAHPQIQPIAISICTVLVAIAPSIFEDCMEKILQEHDNVNDALIIK